jgi:hypothetical protein
MIGASSDVQDVATAMRAVDDDLRSGDLVGAAVQPLADAWGSELAGRVSGPQDQRALVDGAVGLVEQGSLVLDAAAGVPLSGGLVPSEQGAAVEFGSDRPGLPARTAEGRIVMPAARAFGEQFVTLADYTITDAYQEAVGD